MAGHGSSSKQPMESSTSLCNSSRSNDSAIATKVDNFDPHDHFFMSRSVSLYNAMTPNKMNKRKKNIKNQRPFADTKQRQQQQQQHRIMSSSTTKATSSNIISIWSPPDNGSNLFCIDTDEDLEETIQFSNSKHYPTEVLRRRKWLFAGTSPIVIDSSSIARSTNDHLSLGGSTKSQINDTENDRRRGKVGSTSSTSLKDDSYSFHDQVQRDIIIDSATIIEKERYDDANVSTGKKLTSIGSDNSSLHTSGAAIPSDNSRMCPSSHVNLKHRPDDGLRHEELRHDDDDTERVSMKSFTDDPMTQNSSTSTSSSLLDLNQTSSNIIEELDKCVDEGNWEKIVHMANLSDGVLKDQNDDISTNCSDNDSEDRTVSKNSKYPSVGYETNEPVQVFSSEKSIQPIIYPARAAAIDRYVQAGEWENLIDATLRYEYEDEAFDDVGDEESMDYFEYDTIDNDTNNNIDLLMDVDDMPLTTNTGTSYFNQRTETQTTIFGLVIKENQGEEDQEAKELVETNAKSFWYCDTTNIANMEEAFPTPRYDSRYTAERIGQDERSNEDDMFAGDTKFHNNVSTEPSFVEDDDCRIFEDKKVQIGNCRQESSVLTSKCLLRSKDIGKTKTSACPMKLVENSHQLDDVDVQAQAHSDIAITQKMIYEDIMTSPDTASDHSTEQDVGTIHRSSQYELSVSPSLNGGKVETQVSSSVTQPNFANVYNPYCLNDYNEDPEIRTETLFDKPLETAKASSVLLDNEASVFLIDWSSGYSGGCLYSGLHTLSSIPECRSFGEYETLYGSDTREFSGTALRTAAPSNVPNIRYDSYFASGSGQGRSQSQTYYTQLERNLEERKVYSSDFYDGSTSLCVTPTHSQTNIGRKRSDQKEALFDQGQECQNRDQSRLQAMFNSSPRRTNNNTRKQQQAHQQEEEQRPPQKALSSGNSCHESIESQIHIDDMVNACILVDESTRISIPFFVKGEDDQGPCGDRDNSSDQKSEKMKRKKWGKEGIGKFGVNILKRLMGKGSQHVFTGFGESRRKLKVKTTSKLGS